MVYLKENINLGGKVHYPINFHCPQLNEVKQTIGEQQYNFFD